MNNNDEMLNTAKEYAAKALNEMNGIGKHDEDFENDPAKWIVKNIDNSVNCSDMYIVWFCKTLQNWKALASTDKLAGLYVEVTHNGDKKETYVDVYKKAFNEAYTKE